jgi:hypothetical protein
MAQIIEIPTMSPLPKNIFGLYEILHPVLESYEDVILDFKKCKFFAGNLCSMLGALIIKKRRNGGNVEFCNISPKVNDVFVKNNFYCKVIEPELPHKPTYTYDLGPFEQFDLTSYEEYDDYIDKKFLTND